MQCPHWLWLFIGVTTASPVLEIYYFAHRIENKFEANPTHCRICPKSALSQQGEQWNWCGENTPKHQCSIKFNVRINKFGDMIYQCSSQPKKTSTNSLYRPWAWGLRKQDDAEYRPKSLVLTTISHSPDISPTAGSFHGTSFQQLRYCIFSLSV